MLGQLEPTSYLTGIPGEGGSIAIVTTDSRTATQTRVGKGVAARWCHRQSHTELVMRGELASIPEGGEPQSATSGCSLCGGLQLIIPKPIHHAQRTGHFSTSSQLVCSLFSGASAPAQWERPSNSLCVCRWPFFIIKKKKGKEKRMWS